jgi:hypothetical protein
MKLEGPKPLQEFIKKERSQKTKTKTMFSYLMPNIWRSCVG